MSVLEILKTLGIGLIAVSLGFAIYWMMVSLYNSKNVWGFTVWVLCWCAISFGIGYLVQLVVKYLPVVCKLAGCYDKVEKFLNIFK